MLASGFNRDDLEVFADHRMILSTLLPVRDGGAKILPCAKVSQPPICFSRNIRAMPEHCFSCNSRLPHPAGAFTVT
jgi:hypothetical protein